MSITRFLKRAGVAVSALAAASAAVVLPATTASAAPDASFVVSEAQFNQIFPNRNSFYTYSGLTDALSRVPRLRQHRRRHREEAGSGRVPGERRPRNRRPRLHRRAEHRELPALLRHQPALRLPRRPSRLLRPRPDPAQLELQLQGRRRRARHRPARQPLPGRAERGRRVEDRPLVLEHPDRPGHHDPARRDGQPARASAKRSAASTGPSSATAATRRRCRAGSTSTRRSPGSSGSRPGDNLSC